MHKRNAALALYAIAPLAMLTAFSAIFIEHREGALIQQTMRDEIAAEEVAKKAVLQAEMEASLQKQSEAISKAKTKALADKEEVILKKKAEELADVEFRLNETLQDIARLSVQLSTLDEQLGGEREARTALEHAYVERSLRISRLIAEKDAADLDTQRLTSLLAQIVDDELNIAKQQVPAPTY